eukprot:g15729.t1
MGDGDRDNVSIFNSMASYESAPFSSNRKLTSASPSKGKDPATPLDQAEVLTVINEYRRQHGAPPLQWSEACAREAQKRASHRAGPPAEFGENLARSINMDWRNHTTACVASIHKWQNERGGYDYTKPGLSSNTNHFTNNVWKLTTHIGFGVSRALYKGKSTVWVVAFFFPRGNQAGDFARNVLPPGSVYDGDDNMVRLAIDDTPASEGGRRGSSTPPSFVRVSTVNTEVKSLRSENGNFRFQILPNRDIVVRERERVIWTSGSGTSHPVSSPFRLVLQKNGDLVAYDSSSRAFWSSETANCGPMPYTLTLKDDGNCVLFDGRWVARWATVFKK